MSVADTANVIARSAAEAGDDSAPHAASFATVPRPGAARSCRRFAVPFAVTALAMVWIARNVHWSDRVAPDRMVGATEGLSPATVIEPGLATLWRRAGGGWLLGHVGCLAATLCAMGWRLRLLARSCGVEVPMAWVVATQARCQVINLLPLSQVGGDLYRLAQLRQRMARPAAAVAVILAERLAGLGGLSLVAVGGLLWMRAGGCIAALLITLLTAGLIAAGRALARWDFRAVDRALPGPRWLASVADRVREAQEALVEILGAPRRLALIMSCSVAVQGLAALAYVCLDRALGLTTPAWCYLIAIPALVLAQYVPIHVAGLGLVEGGLYLLLHRWVARSAQEILALSAVARLIGLVWAALLSTTFLIPNSKPMSRPGNESRAAPASSPAPRSRPPDAASVPS